MRLNTKWMDARRSTQPMAIPLASGATPQTPFCIQPSGLAMHCTHGVVAHRSFGITKLRDSRLALRAMHGQRTFVSY